MADVGLKIWNVIELVSYFFLYKVFRLKLTEKQFQSFMQFVKFGIVGVSNTVVSYVIYLVALLFLEHNHIFSDADYIIAQVVAFILSVLWSFYWNNRYVFKKDDGIERIWWKALFKTYISYAFTGLFLNTVLSILWIEVLGISKLIAPIINLLVSVPINFLMNKYWAFKKSDKVE